MTHVARRKVAGLLLAGGRSTRMGADKALVDFAGAPMIAWCAAALAECAPVVVISSANQRHADQCARAVADAWPKFTVLRGVKVETAVDQSEGRGPLAGFAAGMERAVSEQVAVSACDTPLVPAAFYRCALGVLGDAAAVAPHLEEPEPLISVWRREPALAHARLLLESGKGPRALLEALPSLLIHEPELRSWGIDPARLASANTPQALARLRALAAS